MSPRKPREVRLSTTPSAEAIADLRLGDVAKVSGDDALEVERVRDIDLRYVPSPGYSRLLHRARLQLCAGQLQPA